MPPNKEVKQVCWVDGCENQQYKDYLVCRKHFKVDAKIKVPGVTGNNPNIPK